MKKRYMVLVLLSFFFLGNCTKDDDHAVYISTSTRGDTVVLAFNTPTTLFAPDIPRLRITVISINDSRCPVNFVCIWGGILRADVKVGESVVTLTKDQPQDLFYQTQKLSVTLVDVTPYLQMPPQVQPTDRKIAIRILSH